jgi:hypothetical protein
MSSEIAAAGPAILALVAGERPLARVGTLVHGEITARGTTKRTFVAGERPLAGMRALVHG